MLETRKASGIEDSFGEEATPLPENFDSHEAGNQVRNELVGRDITDNPSAYARFAPVIDDYLKAHLFGDIFARDTLSYKDREIATLSALAAMEGLSPQLKGHFRVSLNVGLSQTELLDFVQALKTSVSAKSADTAGDALSEVIAERYSAEGIRVSRAGIHPPTKGSPDYFTGTAEIDNRFGKHPPSVVRGATVTFEAGARTAWHTHQHGQLLIVTEGSGLVQEWGEAAKVIRPGDSVWIPPHKKHWHGASANSPMAHIAIVEDPQGNATEWMELVTDEQYSEANK
ncbi:MAG: carboxymuconolactone decarboxylase [Puniceicoccaceae bacterium]|nr:carboxymuconolactone decarboxylase [Puniceicoccaceae bacterium]